MQVPIRSEGRRGKWVDVPCSGGIDGYGHGSICEAVKPLGKKCQGNGLLQKIDTLTSSTEEKNQEESAHKDQLESKIDSILSKVEGLMAKSEETENRFNEIHSRFIKKLKVNKVLWMKRLKTLVTQYRN